MASKVVGLDFTQPDTLAALEYLTDILNKKELTGLVFAFTRRGGTPLFGMTGRLAENPTEAAGVASMLHCQLTRHALEY